jgi:hypothetical protein
MRIGQPNLHWLQAYNRTDEGSQSRATPIDGLWQGTSHWIQKCPQNDCPCLFMMAFGCAAGLNVARTDRDADGLSIPGRTAAALYDRVKAISPKTIIFFPLPRNETQFLALADYSLASGVLFNGGTVLSASGGLSLRAGAGRCGVGHGLCRYIRPNQGRHKKRA